MPSQLQDIGMERHFAHPDADSSHDEPVRTGGLHRGIQAASRYVMRKAVMLGAVGLMVLVIGEIWLRLPNAPTGIQYMYDQDLGHRYMPNHVAFPRPMGLFSVDTPAMVFDEAGFRNSAVDWTKPVVVALGSSEIVGPGVSEKEIWTVRLEKLLNETGNTPVTVYNTGTASYGPYHQMVVLRRFVQQHGNPALIIVRASVADREFLPMSAEELRQEKVKKEQRDHMKRYTRFLPFLLAKAQLQFNSIREIPASLRPGQSNGVLAEGGSKTAAQRMWEQHKEYWNEMVTLAEDRHIPIVVFVSDPYGTDGGKTLFETLNATFGKRSCTFVWLLDSRPFGLFQNDASERLRVFADTYTLRYDPHANALQHRIIADELFAYLQSLPIPVNHDGPCPSR